MVIYVYNFAYNHGLNKVFCIFHSLHWWPMKSIWKITDIRTYWFCFFRHILFRLNWRLSLFCQVWNLFDQAEDVKKMLKRYFIESIFKGLLFFLVLLWSLSHTWFKACKICRNVAELVHRPVERNQDGISGGKSPRGDGAIHPVNHQIYIYLRKSKLSSFRRNFADEIGVRLFSIGVNLYYHEDFPPECWISNAGGASYQQLLNVVIWLIFIQNDKMSSSACSGDILVWLCRIYFTY